MEYLLSERFVLTGMLFLKIFEMTSPLSKFLQMKNIDLLAAVNYVQNILTTIKNLRNDIKFGNLIDQKNTFIQSKQNDFSFTPIVSTRIKRIKKMVGESASDENITDSIDHFRIKTYIVILDILITRISERFNENHSPLYKDISLFQRKRLREVKNFLLICLWMHLMHLVVFMGSFVQLTFLEKNIYSFVVYIF